MAEVTMNEIRKTIATSLVTAFGIVKSSYPVKLADGLPYHRRL